MGQKCKYNGGDNYSEKVIDYVKGHEVIPVCPELGLMEDPVTGSTHCMIAPYWCDRLGKEKLVCYQASERTGVLYAERKGERIILSGKAVLYSEGNILE